jgi:hypothetical protein
LKPPDGVFIRAKLLGAFVKIAVTKKNSRPGSFGEYFFVHFLNKKNAVFFISYRQIFYVLSHADSVYVLKGKGKRGMETAKSTAQPMKRQ